MALWAAWRCSTLKKMTKTTFGSVGETISSGKSRGAPFAPPPRVAMPDSSDDEEEAPP